MSKRAIFSMLEAGAQSNVDELNSIKAKCIESFIEIISKSKNDLSGSNFHRYIYKCSLSPA